MHRPEVPFATSLSASPMRRQYLAASAAACLLAGCSSAPTPTARSAATLTLVAGRLVYPLGGAATSLCFVYRDVFGSQVFLTRQLAIRGYSLEGTLLPFKPPGTFTNFTTTVPSARAGVVTFVYVDPAGAPTAKQAYVAASGSLRVTAEAANTMSWYADLSLIAEGSGPGPATGHVTGPFSCTVYHEAPQYTYPSATAAPTPPATNPAVDFPTLPSG